jgi:hypoxanthine phosphoribosyltransferase
MKERVSILLEQEAIALRVKEIAKEISNDFSSESLVCICVLKGAFIFMADLIKQISIPVRIDYLVASSYSKQTESSGNVEIKLDIDTEINEKNVLLIEDIVDTGQTIEAISNILLQRNPKTLRTCVLVNRPDRRKKSIQLDYVGFTIPNKFLVGYGLDYAEKYRNLPFIGKITGID